VEIRKKRLRERLQRILDISLSDHSSAWELDSEGVYHLRRDTTQDRIHGTQQVFMDETRRLKHVSDPPWDL
jgi:polyphosphate kinase